MDTLKLVDVNKHYKTKHALKNFSFEFTSGIYGLLGPNGAGKSTLMNIITDNIGFDNGGAVLWNDKPTTKLGRDFRKILGYMPQQQNLYPSMTARRFLGYIASLKGVDRHKVNEEITRLLTLVELIDNKDDKIGGFSGGMKQRLLFASSLLGDTKLLVLDEPTAGLDPRQRVILRDIISKLSDDKIIIISTHITSDIESIADKIIMLKDGEIIHKGTIPEIVDSEQQSLEQVYMKHYGEDVYENTDL